MSMNKNKNELNTTALWQRQANNLRHSVTDQIVARAISNLRARAVMPMENGSTVQLFAIPRELVPRTFGLSRNFGRRIPQELVRDIVGEAAATALGKTGLHGFEHAPELSTQPAELSDTWAIVALRHATFAPDPTMN